MGHAKLNRVLFFASPVLPHP